MNTYKIMHSTDVIALCNNNEITEIILPELCPSCFFVGMPLAYWLQARMVDIHRSHSRQLFKALRLKSYDDRDLRDILSIGHALTVTDDWWIQGISDNLSLHDLREYNKSLADISLNGLSHDNSANHGYTQLGTTGSYEKCWRYVDNRWLMYKRGDFSELVSEYFSYLFLQYLGVNVATYSISTSVNTLGTVDYFIITEDFTNQRCDFEPFYNMFSDNEDISYIIKNLREDLVKSYVEMLYYDALLFNIDRHNENVGVLRDRSTGEIISLAPYFDYNLSLVANGKPTFVTASGNMLLREFKGNIDCMNLLPFFKPLREDVLSAIDYVNNEVLKIFGNIDTTVICDYIISAYDYLSTN